jgi:hypothetical protein
LFKFKIYSNQNLFKFEICSNSNFVQIQILSVFQNFEQNSKFVHVSNFEQIRIFLISQICSNFVQNQNLFKIKIVSIRNLNKFRNLNCLNFRKENRKKTKKEKNREKNTTWAGPIPILHGRSRLRRANAWRVGAPLAHGHPTRVGRVWVAVSTHGSCLWATRLVVGRAWTQTWTHGQSEWVARLADRWVLNS